MKRILVIVFLLCFSSISFGGFLAELEMFKDDLPTLAEMEYIKANTKIPGFKQELDAMIKAVRAGYENQYWFDLDVDIDDPDSVARVELITPNDNIIKFDRVDTYDFDIEKGYFTVDQMKADFPPGLYTVQVIHRDGTSESKTFTLQSYTGSDYPAFVNGSLSWEGNYLNLHFSSVSNVSHYEIEAVTIKDDVDLWGNDSFYLSYPGETTITFDNNIEKGLYDCDIDVSAKRAFGGGDVDVWLISCKNWFSFTQELPVYEDKITQCTISAGKDNMDLISFSGQLGASEEDFIFADEIRVELSADAMAGSNVFIFPINAKTLKNGKYSYSGTDDKKIYSQLKYESKTHLFAFSSKNLDLTGLACPATVTITIGDYKAERELTEAIVNGTKPCPAALMMGVQNGLDVTKFLCKRGKAVGTDTLAAQGTFNVIGEIQQPSNPFVLTLGSQTFTVAANKFPPLKNGVVTCTNTAAQEGGLVSVKFDTHTGLFSIAVKNASIVGYGVVKFDLNLFGFPLLGIETVSLGNPTTVAVTPPIVWISINDPGVPGHEGFNGQMSKYEITNAQYCEYLNAAKASGDIYVWDMNVKNAGGDYINEPLYFLEGLGSTYDGAYKGGKTRIHYSNGQFTVEKGFEKHPVSYVSWFGAIAFATYYGLRLPTEWEWQAVADYNGSYIYGCGLTIKNSIANYYGSNHPYGTTPVGAMGSYGYGMADMAGNVSEWTSSPWDYGGEAYRVIRGGGWRDGDSMYSGHYCSVSSRLYYGEPYVTNRDIGFRVCR